MGYMYVVYWKVIIPSPSTCNFYPFILRVKKVLLLYPRMDLNHFEFYWFKMLLWDALGKYKLICPLSIPPSPWASLRIFECNDQYQGWNLNCSIEKQSKLNNLNIDWKGEVSGLSIRAVTCNTCYNWVCLMGPSCYGNLAVVETMWKSRLQMNQDLMTAQRITAEKLIKTHSLNRIGGGECDLSM